MNVLLAFGLAAAGYILGSIPSGMLIVRLTTGRDIRQVGSGRTGGTNAMRAGGSLAGLATGVLDVLKSFLAVHLCRWAMPGVFWMEALVGLAAVLGHNYSLFSIDWKKTRLGTVPVFHGGAGGAPTLGAATAFWFPSLYFILPIGLFCFMVIGYASVATLAGGLTVTVLFAVRAALGYSSKWYAAFGVVTLALMALSLRPNLGRLWHGTERVVGLRAWRKQRREAAADQPSAPEEQDQHQQRDRINT
ncbi:MAG: glycerol-3-phosphate acyltransferase [Anaerolineales bacterium]|nr:glycerol-3-phosphate acyltransferase [Anaerolineales bacterium]